MFIAAALVWAFLILLSGWSAYHEHRRHVLKACPPWFETTRDVLQVVFNWAQLAAIIIIFVAEFMSHRFLIAIPLSILWIAIGFFLHGRSDSLGAKLANISLFRPTKHPRTGT